jgi:hypothetical protein
MKSRNLESRKQKAEGRGQRAEDRELTTEAE